MSEKVHEVENGVVYPVLCPEGRRYVVIEKFGDVVESEIKSGWFRMAINCRCVSPPPEGVNPKIRLYMWGGFEAMQMLSQSELIWHGRMIEIHVRHRPYNGDKMFSASVRDWNPEIRPS